MKRIILILIITIFLIPNTVNASEETMSQDEILQSQQESLNIDSFINEAQKYTKDVYEDIDMGELFSSAISGDVDNQTILKSIAKSMRWRGIR